MLKKKSLLSYISATCLSLCLPACQLPMGQLIDGSAQTAKQTNQVQSTKAEAISLTKPLYQATAHVESQPGHPGYAKIRVQLQIPKSQQGFQTQAVDASQFTRVGASINGIGISGDLYADGADGGGFISQTGSDTSLTFSNVPYGSKRVLSILFSDPIGGIEHLARIDQAFDLSASTASLDISYRTSPTAWIVREFLSTTADQERISDLSLSALQSFVDQVTGVTGTAPNYSYTLHPWLVNGIAIANDLKANNGNIALLNSSDPDYQLSPASLDVTVAGLVSTDQAHLRVTDITSPFLQNLGNGPHTINAIQPKVDNTFATWDLIATTSGGTTYTANYSTSQSVGVSTEGQNLNRTVTLTPATPDISSLSSNSGIAGNTITINGSNFHANAEGNVVKFGATVVPTSDITVISSTQITAKVPTGITGSKPITVSVGNQSSNSQAFSVDGIPSNKISFISSRDGNNEVYGMDDNGANPSNISNDIGNESYAAISPDGMKIAFTTERDGNAEIYVMNVDGSNQVNISNHASQDYFPAWSPDGSQIIFSSDRDGDIDIYKMDLTGNNQIQIANLAGNDFYPKWSPDGSTILYRSDISGNADIFVMGANGTNSINLSNSSNNDEHPDWSPDGRYIVFERQFSGPSDFEIFIMNKDGSNQTNITNHSEFDRFPSWSSDGSKIVFNSDRDGAFGGELYSMNANGSSITRLTNNLDSDVYADWFQHIPTPSVSSLSASSAFARDTITITGANFSSVANQNVVKFGTVETSPSDVTYISPTQLEVKVPRLEPSYTTITVPVTVRVANKVSNSTNIEVKPGAFAVYSAPDYTGDFHIFKMDLDGANKRYLFGDPTDTDGNALHPVMSPDGSKIAFISSDNDPQGYRLNIMDADGVPLCATPGNVNGDRPFIESTPAWSPDGTEIVYGAQNGNLIKADSDCSIVNDALATNALQSNPHWHPDGSKILFSGNSGLSTIDPNGNNFTSLGIASQTGRWSPDGNQIYFTEHDGTDFEIKRSDANGGNIISLTNNISDDGQSSATIPNPGGAVIINIFGLELLPDGSKIGFVSTRDGNNELYTMDTDGNNVTRLTNDPDDDFDISWWQPLATPSISSLSQTSGGSAKSITINGQNFSSITNQNVVTFGGVQTHNIQYLSPTQLQATVPGGISGSAPVQVRVATQKSNSLSFTADKRILFSNNDNNPNNIHVINTDGSDYTQIGPIAHYSPAVWSHDGKLIAAKTTFGNNIAIIRADGSLLRYVGSSISGGDLTWAPDNRTLIVTDASGNFYKLDIYTNIQTLFTNTGNNFAPAWAPNNSKIAFTSSRDGNGELYTMNPDGTGITRLTFTAQDETAVQWSFDSQKIVYQRNGLIYSSFANGTSEVLCNVPFSPLSAPRWTSDGKIIFSAWMGLPNYYDIYTANPDGSNQVRITNSNRTELSPGWQPQ